MKVLFPQNPVGDRNLAGEPRFVFEEEESHPLVVCLLIMDDEKGEWLYYSHCFRVYKTFCEMIKSLAFGGHFYPSNLREVPKELWKIYDFNLLISK